MKTAFLISLALLTANCDSQKTALINKAALHSDCPTDGTCTIELQKGKSLEIKTDDHGGMYYQLLDNANKNVFVYHYTKHKDSTLADAGYREEVMFEVDATMTELKLTNLELEKVKALYGRFCFCRGATGYYRINEGTLSIKKDKQEYEVTMDFKISEVPQIISRIAITAK